MPIYFPFYFTTEKIDRIGKSRPRNSLLASKTLQPPPSFRKRPAQVWTVLPRGQGGKQDTTEELQGEVTVFMLGAGRGPIISQILKAAQDSKKR